MWFHEDLVVTSAVTFDQTFGLAFQSAAFSIRLALIAIMQRSMKFTKHMAFTVELDRSIFWTLAGFVLAPKFL